MFFLAIENAGGRVIELTHHGENYTVTHVSGLLPPKNNINTSTAGLTDGSTYNSSHMENRNIVITLVLNGDIEANRQRIYSIFPFKSECTVYFSNQRRNVKIKGWVELIDGDVFSKREVIQISVICPRPYWESIQMLQAELSRSIGFFTFPFSIPEEGIVISGSYPYPVAIADNKGDASVGFVCTLRVADAAPELTADTVTFSPDVIAKRRVLVPLSTAEYSGSPQYLEVYVNHVLKTESTDYDLKYCTYEDNARDLYIEFLTGHYITVGAAVRVDVCDTGDVNQPEYTSVKKMFHSTLEFDLPDWYDENAEITSLVAHQEANPEILINPDDYTYSIQNGKIVVSYVIGSHVGTEAYQWIVVDGVKHNQKVVTTSKTVSAAVPDELFTSLPDYTANDLIRIYIGDNKLNGWSMENAVFTHLDGTYIDTEYCFHLGTPAYSKVKMQIISSVSGENVSDYTDTQVDEGLKLVDALTLTNATTGEKISFSGEKFRPGDVIVFSTVYGDVYAKCVESTWMTPGENLMYAVDADSDFPYLIPGKNLIQVTADTNQELVSGEMSAKRLYGGV